VKFTSKSTIHQARVWGMQVSGRLQGPGTDRPFQTDAQGVMALSNLPDGRYLLEVSKDGFVTQSVRINVESRTASSRTITYGSGYSLDDR
jgi:hypothetical protein